MTVILSWALLGGRRKQAPSDLAGLECLGRPIHGDSVAVLLQRTRRTRGQEDKRTSRKRCGRARCVSFL